MNTLTNQTGLNPDALPYAGWARAVTAIFHFFGGFRTLIASLDQALAAAEVSRDLYATTTSALAARSITTEQVPDYVARKLISAAGYPARVANDDARRAPAA